MAILNYYVRSNMFLEVDKRMKACICEGVALLLKTTLEEENNLYRQNQANLLERIRLTGIQLTEAVLKTRGSQDLILFAQPLYRRLSGTLVFLDTLKEDWKEKKKAGLEADAFDFEFLDDLQTSLTRKRNLLTDHIPSFLYTPYFTVANLRDALREAEAFNRTETEKEMIVARRLAFVFADLENRGVLYKLPEKILFSYVNIYVSCSEEYIRKNLMSIKDGFKGDLTKATAWKYMDEARDFIRRFNISG